MMQSTSQAIADGFGSMGSSGATSGRQHFGRANGCFAGLCHGAHRDVRRLAAGVSRGLRFRWDLRYCD
jgi:hypothetical protein